MIFLSIQSDLTYELESRAQTLQDIINNYIEVETGLEVRVAFGTGSSYINVLYMATWLALLCTVRLRPVFQLPAV